MKSISALFLNAGVASASFWDSYNCADAIVNMPANATENIFYFVGDNVADDYNESEFSYEWFTGELGAGTPV